MKKLSLIAATAIVSLLSATSALANQDLAQKRNCLACHALDKKIVGPAYKDVAAKYAKDKDAVTKLAEKIQKGGSGVWGPLPMPPNTTVTPEEAKTLAKWVLTIK
jgi:cytochrome c